MRFHINLYDNRISKCSKCCLTLLAKLARCFIISILHLLQAWDFFQMHFEYLAFQKKIIIYFTHVVLLYLMNQVKDDVTALPELCLIIV